MRLLSFGALLSIFSLSAIPTAHAASTYWVSPQDAAYLWNDAANWSDGIPSDGDRLVFRSSDAFQAQTPSDNDIADLLVSDLVFVGTSATNGFLLSGNSFRLSNEIRNTNTGGNSTEVSNGVFATGPIQMTTINASHNQSGNMQLYSNDLKLRTFKSSLLVIDGSTVSGGLNSSIIISGDKTGTTRITDLSYVGPPIRVVEGGKLVASGQLHDNLTVTKYGLLQPERCLDVPVSFVIRGGYYYPSITGIPGIGPGACNTQNKLRVEGKVDLTYATLAYSRMLDSGYTPTVGTRYVLISNGGDDKVIGAFKGLPEGSTFTVDGVRFRISYKGATGNDVVVTRI